MKIINSLSELRSWRKSLLIEGKTLAFVPTMGNLHEGHITLVKTALTKADVVITSIFVNPMQFGANEDLDAYPRTFEADCSKLSEAGNHAVFYPSVEDMYPNGLDAQTFVEVPDTEDTLCAEATQRPGHFRGVSTVVAKLFNMVQPDIAVFGEKDYQQLRLIRTMVSDLNMPIDIVGVPTVRESSGLAKSSRNGYLTAEEKCKAPALNKAIIAAKQAILEGDLDTRVLADTARKSINAAGLKTDYVIIRDAHTLAHIDKNTQDFVILGAAYLGKARLIDNISFSK
jgi:pantoate--beta-alanine ligase